jgi:5-formyltetrahydrofolate cyclo-ligase
LIILIKLGTEMCDKRVLRRAVRERVAMIDAPDAQERSAAICEEVKRHIAVSGARVVALFAPLDDEPQLWSLVEHLAQRLSVVLPRVEGDVMNFYSFDKGMMATGAFGISEPQGGVPVQACEIEAIVVPGVAFTESGARMGRGKGYYDRYLSQSDFSALKIGVCYREQIVPEIPAEPHDVPMDVVIYK